MAIPKFFDFFVPTLRVLNEKSPLKVNQLFEILAAEMQLTPIDMAEMLPSGRQQTYKNRIHWCLQYLKNAGLIASVARATYTITDRGKQSLIEDADKINLHYLEQFDSFVKFHGRKTEQALSNDIEETSIENTLTPLEARMYRHLLARCWEKALPRVCSSRQANSASLPVNTSKIKRPCALSWWMERN